MKEHEIFTSAIKLLRSGEERTTKEIADFIGKASGTKVSETQVFDVFVNLERTHKVQRSDKYKRFDEYKPVTTTSWILLDQDSPTAEEAPEQISIDYISTAKLVVSQPIFLTTRGLEFKNLDIPILSVTEAMEKIVLDATEEIRIACPYYDEFFLDVLSRNARNIGKLKALSVLAEKADHILLKVCRLFPNTKLKTLYGSTSSESQNDLKVQGLHAKVMIADKSQVLIGSFNFRFSHLHYNVDMGLLLNGKIAEHYARLFDMIWDANL